jgi:hypothetical protein
VASTISTPRPESDTGPTAEHRTALARALGWADEAAARGDYATGINAHGHPPVQTAPNPRSADRKGCRTNEISGRGLLDVMADFDQFGGASRELVAFGSYSSRRAQSRRRGRGRSPTAYWSAPEPTKCLAK